MKKYALVRTVFVKYPHTVWARVIAEDKPFWGIFGTRYALRSKVRWTYKKPRVEQYDYVKWWWQIKAFAAEADL